MAKMICSKNQNGVQPSTYSYPSFERRRQEGVRTPFIPTIIPCCTQGPTFSCQFRIVELSIKRCALATTQLRIRITSSCVILAGDLAQVGFEPTTTAPVLRSTSELPSLPR